MLSILQNVIKLYFASTKPLIFKLVHFKTLTQVWHYKFNKLLTIFDHFKKVLKPKFNMAGFYVSRRCRVVPRTPLAFSWTGQGGTWVLAAMNGLSTGLTWLTSNGRLLRLVDCVIELSSGSPALGRTCVYIQRVSTGLEGSGSETAVSQKAHLSWQDNQIGLTSWTGT